LKSDADYLAKSRPWIDRDCRGRAVLAQVACQVNANTSINQPGVIATLQSAVMAGDYQQ